MPDYKTPPAHLDQPQGQAAQLLRRTLQDSMYDSQRDLVNKGKINYRENTVAQYLNGSRLQNPVFVEKFVNRCIPGDPVRATARIQEVLALIRPSFSSLARQLDETYQASAWTSVDELAATLGVNVEVIGTWLSGVARPDDEQIEEFVRACIPDEQRAADRIQTIKASPAPLTPAQGTEQQSADQQSTQQESVEETAAGGATADGATAGGATAGGATAGGATAGGATADRAATPGVTTAGVTTAGAATTGAATTGAATTVGVGGSKDTGSEGTATGDGGPAGQEAVRQQVEPGAQGQGGPGQQGEVPLANGRPAGAGTPPEDVAGGQRPGAESVGGPGPSRRRWLVLAGVLVLLLVLAGGGYALTRETTTTTPPPPAAAPMCGPGVLRAGDGQCIGVSDGSVNVASDPAFDTVLGKIKKENDRVLALGDPVVSVAYLVPIPKNNPLLSAQFVRSLEGAYLVQLQRNEAGQPDIDLGGKPRLQLLVGNLGDLGEQGGLAGSPVVTQIGQLANPTSRAPLVAVAGLDQSLAGVSNVITGIGALQIPRPDGGVQQGIPMVAARVTGDGMAADADRNGFFAISPPSSAQVAKLVATLGPQAKVLIVQDTTGGDLYGPQLATLFQSQFAAIPGATALPPAVTFDSKGEGVGEAIKQVNEAVCKVRPTAVFFAGRGSNLSDLVRALGTRRCDPPLTVNIVTTSDGRLLSGALQNEAATPNINREIFNGMNSGVTVTATAQAHPGLWSDESLVPTSSHTVLDGGFATAFPQQFPTATGPGQVDAGGDTIMGHDALQVIVEAIQRARDPQADNRTQPITPGLIRQALRSAVTVYNPVLGASGPIYFGSTAGFAVNKNIALTTIDPSGAIILRR